MPTLVLPIREYLLAGLTAAVITFLLVGPVRLLALKLGAVAWPRGRDVHVTPTPRWGGLAMLGGVLAGVAMAYQLPALRLAFDTSSAEVLGAVLAGVLLVGVGALDDRYDLDALTKFAGQTTAAGVLIIFGVQWSTFWIPFGGGGDGISGSVLSLGYGQGMLLTVLFTVVLVNAMNFVDGLDGLAAGIGMIGALAVGTFAISLILQYGNDPSYYSPALIAAVLGGACVGFLPHNFNPARIFMGDSGSMLIGVLARRRDDQRVREDPGGGRLAALLPGVTGSPDRVRRRALRAGARPADGDRAAHPRGHEPVLARQDAPPPPVAGNRSQPAKSGAADLPVGGRVGVRGGGAHVHHRCRRGALDGRFRAAARRARLRHTPDAPPRVETDRTETISRRSRGVGRPGHPVVASPSRAGRSAWFVPWDEPLPGRRRRSW